MKVLAIDPGAERCGWALLQKEVVDGVIDTPVLLDSGILGINRNDLQFQKYRLLLIDYWVRKTKVLLKHKPDYVVNEIIPAVGGGNFVVATQSHLAATALVTIQTISVLNKYPIRQIGATTVKSKIGGSKKATKVQVRNGVTKILGEKILKSDWTKVFDESDACAIGLASMGYVA